MNIQDYHEFMTADILMGPNSARILEELLRKHPFTLHSDARILDLGCGKGLSSFILARETGAKVYANDLWNSAEDNQKRFTAWGVGNQITPICEDAGKSDFSGISFDCIVSIDAYHYFAGDIGFFETKLLPVLKDNAVVLIGIPGIRDAYAGRSEALLSEWVGNEAYMFQSPSEWKKTIGNHERIERVDTWEMECFDLAWHEWFATENQFALGDKPFYETVIKPYTCIVGIYVKLK